eukprot:Skav216917  [mRNA]  locus=scaffold1838:34358:35779:- [translate_table: standard]
MQAAVETPPQENEMPPEPVMLRFACDHCTAVFATATALSVHQKKQHNIASMVRAYMHHPTRCLSCLFNYQTTQRLRQHLQHKPDECLAHLRAVLLPMTPEEIQAQTTVMQKQTGYRIAASREYGPFLPTRAEWAQVRAMPPLPVDAGGEDYIIWSQWLMECQPSCPDQWSRPSPEHLSTPPTVDVLDYVYELARDLHGDGFAEAVHTFLQGGAAKPEPVDANIDPGIPISFRVVLCFQTGEPQLHRMAEAWQYIQQIYDFKVALISVGTTHHTGLQDVSVPSNRAFWKQMVQDGGVIAMLAAPFGPTWLRTPTRVPVRTACQPFGELEVTQTLRYRLQADNRSWLAYLDLSRATYAAQLPQLLFADLSVDVDLIKQLVPWAIRSTQTRVFDFEADSRTCWRIFRYGCHALTECMGRWQSLACQEAKRPHPFFHAAIAETFAQIWCQQTPVVKTCRQSVFAGHLKRSVKLLQVH